MIDDIIAFIGLIVLGFGLFLVYPPAMYIVVGLILILFGVLRARKGAGVDGNTG